MGNTPCARCEIEAAVTGALCRSCLEEVGACAGLLPEHIVVRVLDQVDAWLVDAWGQVHGVVAGGSAIGRRLGSDLGILHESVSREHARLCRESGAWSLRDLGSKNGSLVDGRRVQGRAALKNGALVQLGEVRFAFICDQRALQSLPPDSLATATATRWPAFRVLLRCPESERELRLAAVADSDAAPGVLLFREQGAESWAQMNLTPLEFQLLRVLSERAQSAQRSPDCCSEPHVPTTELARTLPFRSSAADEENVRQVVRRTRRALAQFGIEDLIAVVPRRGYRIRWVVD